jgi:josephin
MVALESKKMNLVWFDKRKEITSTALELTRAFGYILNIPSDYSFGFITLPIKSRHWICIRRLNEKFYNLDSKLDSPRCIGDDTDFVNYLKNEMKQNDKELFIVFPKEES